ncbi:MAG: sulfotransferase [Rubrivivax sp.]|nr:sulfotransferase [Rubrivivax sp.]
MQAKLHFISGLPRSGSTLLSALLSQNPRFHAAMSSPLTSLVNALLREMSQGNEYGMFYSPEQRQRIVKGCFEAYYADIPPDGLAFDTGRMWTSKMPLLSNLFPGSKVICCVRNVAWVLDSIETLTRSNHLEPSRMFAFDASSTVYGRLEGLTAGTGMVGSALFALREAVFGAEADRLLLVRYDSLVSDPLGVLAKLYAFIGEPLYRHDPQRIEPFPEAEEFDARIGAPGLHRLGPVVRANRRPTILPADLFKRYEVFSFWEKPDEMPKGLRVI